MKVPWTEKPLDGWAIVGMNHYHVGGKRHLFVAMTKDGRCIHEEGCDEEALWCRLREKAVTEAGECVPLPVKQGEKPGKVGKG